MDLGHGAWRLAELPSPWGEGESIFKALESESGGGVSFQRPPALEPEQRVLWVRQLACSLQKLCESTEQSTLQCELKQLASLLGRGDAGAVIDELIECIADKGLEYPDRLYEIACYCMTRSNEVGAVRFGIGLASLFPQQDSRPILLRLGSCEALAPSVLVAFLNQEEGALESVFELAKTSKGRGRKLCLQALARAIAQGPDSPGLQEARPDIQPDIRGWVLREGAKGHEQDTELLWLCARVGCLIDTLENPALQDFEFDAAAALLLYLMDAPIERDEELEELQTAVELYLGRLSRWANLRLLSIDHILTLDRARAFLLLNAETSASEIDRAQSQKLVASCHACMERPEWRQRVEVLLRADDRRTFERAAHAADVLNLDVWEHHRSRIQQRPDESASWLRLVQTDDEERLQAAINLAEESLTSGVLFAEGDSVSNSVPKSGQQLGSKGDAESSSLTDCYAAHDTIGAILLRLTGKGGLGCRLLQMALSSPIPHVRHSAVSVLDSWESVPPKLQQALEKSIANEGHVGLREHMRRLMSKASMDASLADPQTLS